MSDGEEYWSGAACIGFDPDWWYEPTMQHKAVAVCETCPLTLKCLTFALEQKDQFGIYGGLTPAERNAIQRKLGRDY